jgi:small subunit ribosomal protein S11
MEKTEFREEKKEKIVPGIAYIYSTFNNTIVHITDISGNTISQFSGGKVTKHSRLKATPTVSMFVAKRAAEQAKEAGINAVFIRVKSKAGSTAPGPGANAAVKSLAREGLKILNILDTIAMPRGGPKPPYGKRGRRV